MSASSPNQQIAAPASNVSFRIVAQGEETGYLEGAAGFIKVRPTKLQRY
ncbi:hypothetical protein [Ruegeria sp. 6PALISEP08]|nr:hypothetical protein [Ruegeria sp. 6PALISEP08]